MLLPKKEYTFVFEYEDEMLTKWEGTFLVKTKLTISEIHKMELERSRLLGNAETPSNVLIDISYALPYIKARVIDGPEWYMKNKGSDLEDIGILYLLFDKVVEAEKKWKEELMEKIKPKQTEDSPLGN
jgi:hypothetical protein